MPAFLCIHIPSLSRVRTSLRRSALSRLSFVMASRVARTELASRLEARVCAGPRRATSPSDSYSTYSGGSGRPGARARGLY